MHTIIIAGLVATLLGMPFGTTSGAASRGAYPSKPIEVIVPWAPGGAAELPVRVVAEFLAKEWGHPINVVNKPGGNTLTGSLALMQAAADGYTLMADSPGSSSLQAAMPEKLPFKVEDRTFVVQMAKSPMVYYVKADSPWKSLKDVAAAAKSTPGAFTWARLGRGSLVDLCLMQFFSDAGVDLAKTKQVVFKGSGESAAAVAGGHVQFASSGPSAVLGYVSSKIVRVLGVTGTTRIEAWPEVPTAIEQGFPSVRGTLWNGISGPANLPGDVVEKWTKGVEKAMKDPTVIERIKKLGATPEFQGSDQFRKAVIEEIQQAQTMK
jgi:tripartite-type tricarboxylate transporter receptor subunit TctC